MNKYTEPEFEARLMSLDPNSMFIQKIQIRTETDSKKISEYNDYQLEIYKEWRKYFYSEEELIEMEKEKARQAMANRMSQLNK